MDFQRKVTAYLLRSGELQYAMLSLVRAFLAVLIVGVACYREVTGTPASEPFYMLVGLVVGMYFEKGTALMGNGPGSEESREELAKETFDGPDPEPVP